MNPMQKTAGIWTLGCKVNQYESQAIAEELERVGFLVASHREICDLYVINTCTVTAESDRKARQFIRRAIKQNPAAYKGHVGDVSMVLRITLTGKSMSPDMYEVMKILGKETVEKRLKAAL